MWTRYRRRSRREREGCDSVLLWLVSMHGDGGRVGDGGRAGDGGREGDDGGGRDTEGGEDESLRVATVCYSGWSPCA